MNKSESKGKVLIDKATTLIDSGEFEEAVGVIDKILKIYPDDIYSLHVKASVLVRQGKYIEVIAVVKKILSLEPDNLLAKKAKKFAEFKIIEGLFNEAIRLQELDKFQEAVEIHKEILMIDPTNVEAFCNWAICLRELNKLEEAVDMFDRAIAIEPEYTDAMFQKIFILIDLKKYGDVISVADNILKIDSSNADALALKKDAQLKQATIEFEQQGIGGEVVEICSIEEFKEMARNGRAVITNDIPELGICREGIIAAEAKSAGAYLFFDTETTGLPSNWNAPVSDLSNWPRLVQIAWILCDKSGNYLEERSFIVKPDGFMIPLETSKIHGISNERAMKEGISLQAALIEFQEALTQATFLVAHNMSFDEKIIGAELLRKNMPNTVILKSRLCTKEMSTNFCAIPSSNGYADYKWPKLSELYYKLFGKMLTDSHDALADTRATAACFWEMKRRGIL